MKCLLIAALSNIAVPAAGRGIEVLPNCFLTADSRRVRELLHHNDFELMAGRLALNELLKSSAVLYSISSVNEPLMEDQITQCLEHFLATANGICMALWALKDNAGMCSEGFYQLHVTGPRHGTFVTRHSSGIFYWDATTARRVVQFSADELRWVRTFLRELPTRLGLSGRPIQTTPTLPADIPRLGRAWYILETARTSSDLATRVAMYVTCLEALFATATQELAHILSERLATFLETSPATQRSLFVEIKKAYGTRSKVLHGDELSKKQRESLPSMVVLCDDLARRSFQKIMALPELIAKFNGKKEELDEFFTDVMFTAGDGRTG